MKQLKFTTITLFLILSNLILSTTLSRNKLNIPKNYSESKLTKMTIGIEKSEPKVYFKSSEIGKMDENDKISSLKSIKHIWSIIFCAPDKTDIGYKGTVLETGLINKFKNLLSCGIESKLTKFNIPLNDLETTNNAQDSSRIIKVVGNHFKLTIQVPDNVASAIALVKDASQFYIKTQIINYQNIYLESKKIKLKLKNKQIKN